MTNQDILRIAMEQSAVDMNCTVAQLSDGGNHVVSSALHADAKKCYHKKLFCGFTFYGTGLVASVDETIRPFIEQFTAKHAGYRCIDAPQLMVLNREFEKYDKSVCYLATFYLPDLTQHVEINSDIKIEILEEHEIPKMFANDRFHNAFGYDNTREKKDVLAVIGYLNGEIVGAAGASNDAEMMWQIGIDVLPNYRRQGVAVTLTKILTDEVLKRGKVPYYCTAWSNIASQRNAIKCGYRNAWVEMTVMDKDETMKMIGEEV